MDKKLEKLSAAVSLTVLEIDFSPNELIPAFLLANLMSPALWAWRSEKNAYSDGDRDKALLLYTLLQHSPISDTESVIGLSNENSFVSHQGKWIDLENLSLLSAEPLELKILFNATSTHT